MRIIARLSATFVPIVFNSFVYKPNVVFLKKREVITNERNCSIFNNIISKIYLFYFNLSLFNHLPPKREQFAGGGAKVKPLVTAASYRDAP